VFNSPGSVTSPTPVTLFAKADSGIATKPKLSLPVVPRLAIETGVNVVGTEPRSLQWPLHLHLNGSFKQMLPKQAGGIVSGCDNKGVWSEEEKMFHINVLELLASSSEFYQEQNSEGNSFPDRQHNCSEISSKDRGTKSLELLKLSKEIWEILLDRGITITWKTECDSRQGVEEKLDRVQMQCKIWSQEFLYAPPHFA